VITSTIDAAAEFHALAERTRLRALLPEYVRRCAGRDMDPRMFLTAEPLFSQDMEAPSSKITSTLSISADGTVTRVALQDDVDPALSPAVNEALYGWLFYPRIVAGIPQPAEIEVQQYLRGVLSRR
jgi:hypothetical protein